MWHTEKSLDATSIWVALLSMIPLLLNEYQQPMYVIHVTIRKTKRYAMEVINICADKTITNFPEWIPHMYLSICQCLLGVYIDDITWYTNTSANSKMVSQNKSVVLDTLDKCIWYDTTWCHSLSIHVLRPYSKYKQKARDSRATKIQQRIPVGQ